MNRVKDQLLSDIIAKILKAATAGDKLDIQDADQVSQYVFAVMGLGAELIPVVGTAVGALCNLLGTVLFAPNSTGHIWDALHARIEQLVDTKIEEYHLNVLKDKIEGFRNDLDLYGRFLQDFEKAAPKDKKDAADSLKALHIAFLSNLIAGIPEFQDDKYAIPSLPLFSLVATMHLTLLADGIKRGKEWGYTDNNIETLKEQFKAKTFHSSRLMVNTNSSLQNTLLPSSDLKEAIKRGSETGVSTKVLDTWNAAYTTLYKPDSPLVNGIVSPDYPTYVKLIYVRGRSHVNSGKVDPFYGYEDANNSRAYSDYDSFMILNVLNYAEMWPFLIGDTWTQATSRNVDREIFYGPYGRWQAGAPWNFLSPPPGRRP